MRRGQGKGNGWARKWKWMVEVRSRVWNASRAKDLTAESTLSESAEGEKSGCAQRYNISLKRAVMLRFG